MAGVGPICHNLLKNFNKENKNPHYDHPLFVVHVDFPLWQNLQHKNQHKTRIMHNTKSELL